MAWPNLLLFKLHHTATWWYCWAGFVSLMFLPSAVGFCFVKEEKQEKEHFINVNMSTNRDIKTNTSHKWKVFKFISNKDVSPQSVTPPHSITEKTCFCNLTWQDLCVSPGYLSTFERTGIKLYLKDSGTNLLNLLELTWT